MKNSTAFIQHRMAAIAGRLILTVYKAWSALFINQEDFTPPYQPVRRQEIILIKKTGKVYSKIAQQYSLS